MQPFFSTLLCALTFQFLHPPSRDYSASIRRTCFHFCLPHIVSSASALDATGYFRETQNIVWGLLISSLLKKGLWICLCVFMVRFADDQVREFKLIIASIVVQPKYFISVKTECDHF